jgi:hypothetical protein
VTTLEAIEARDAYADYPHWVEINGERQLFATKAEAMAALKRLPEPDQEEQ